MARIKAEDYSFPTNSVEAAKVTKEIDRIVNILNEIEVLKSDIIENCNDAENDLQIPAALLKAYAVTKYDSAKTIVEIEKKQRLLDDQNLEG